MNVVKHALLIFLSLFPFLTFASAKHEPLVLPNIHVVPLKDTQNNRQYELYIKLPQDYEKNTNKNTTYPVIYFTDALWHVEILSGTSEYVIDDAILVGISWQKDLVGARRAWSSRFRDYMPAVIRKDRGEASKHLSFIRRDVIPYIEANYLADSNNRSYFGYSLGGLFGGYILLTEPDTFKNYILGSPDFGEGTALLFNQASGLPAKLKKNSANIFISYGEKEKELGEGVEAFIKKLSDLGAHNMTLKKEVFKAENHSTAFPKTAVDSVYWLADILKDSE